jgi:hypothetical protein
VLLNGDNAVVKVTLARPAAYLDPRANTPMPGTLSASRNYQAKEYP